VRGGGLVVVICDVDLVFVVDVTLTADVDVGCDKARASSTVGDGSFVGKAVIDAIEIATGLQGEGDGLLGGVGNIEATMLILVQEF
jgi:hypothetical protein